MEKYKFDDLAKILKSQTITDVVRTGKSESLFRLELSNGNYVDIFATDLGMWFETKSDPESGIEVWWEIRNFIDENIEMLLAQYSVELNSFDLPNIFDVIADDVDKYFLISEVKNSNIWKIKYSDIKSIYQDNDSWKKISLFDSAEQLKFTLNFYSRHLQWPRKEFLKQIEKWKRGGIK